MTSPPVLVIAGPTATGKTAAAIALAEHFGGELVGADSVQVYRGFDIGSAKLTAAELGTVRHHLIDVIDPDEEIDAAAYAALADRAIEGIRERGRLPIVVGGTGLWIRALLRGLVEVPPVDPDLRKRLEANAHAEGTEALHTRLAAIDPLTAEAVHPNDLVRIVRALEVYEQTGVPLGELREEHALGEPRYQAMFVVLDLDRERHTAVVTARVQAMLDAGWVDEVRALRQRWGDEVRPLGSVGYREVLAHIRDGVPLEKTQRLIRKSTRTYARRQRTWFKGEPGVSWLSESAHLVEQGGRERIARKLGL
ncbi:MAG: tRNA (adenosine(37)-N6)-dimethylallyltransferase MiaA [Deltaproteobacteria bacterium]|nr:tRNA (adenosine(37)-N6)-dimethylallyltransferase MiaA [Deltaproteobacteria bacterium]